MVYSPVFLLERAGILASFLIDSTRSDTFSTAALGFQRQS
jgi:hypothetical protein